MKPVNTYYNIHSHTHFSNNRFLDSMNSVHDLIVNAKKKGMAGIGITDHGVLSGHIKVAKMMDAHPEFFNGKDGKGPFKVTLGEEIYLDDYDKIAYAHKHNKKTKFYHFVLTAKDDIGYHALRIISTKSWENSFFFRGMRRLPTYKTWLSKLMHNPRFHFKGHLIASTACLGSEMSHDILHRNGKGIFTLLHYLIDTFGADNLFFEMMPADNKKGQQTVNGALWKMSQLSPKDFTAYMNRHDPSSKELGIVRPPKCIISTDAHYIDKNDREAHSIFLKSENPNRDVKDFYYYAHLFTFNELKKYFKSNVLQTAARNSLELLHSIAPIWHLTNEKQMAQETKQDTQNPPIRLHYRQEIPESPMPKIVNPIDLSKYAKKYNIDWSKYPWFNKFNHSPLKQDRYYLHKIFHGIKARNVPMDHTYLHQINWELHTLHILTEYFHEPMSAYFLTVFYAVIDTCWGADSLVGPGRGSAGEWVTNYLLGITQVNSIKWHLWAPRFSCKDRRDDMPDIDLDSESSRRLAIVNYLKKKYGEDRVLNFSTFGTQAAKSTIYSACRGLHIGYTTAQNIANLLPPDSRGMGNISLHDALFGNKKKQIHKATKFIRAVKKHPGLESALLGIGGKIRGVSEHASGVALWNEPLTQRNAMMKTNKAPGIPITQFSAHDSAYLSSLKYDILTLSALDRIHEALRLLIRDGKIKKQYDKNGKFSLYKTYMSHFGPQALNFTDRKMYNMLYDGTVTNAFEFSSIVGRDALVTMHATDFSALVAANALMRLTVNLSSNTFESRMMKKYWGNQQPINRYVYYRDHKGAWDHDMKKAGLTKPEMAIMHKYLGRHRGVCYSQEDLMKISMDPHTAHFPYIKANKLRKAVAKKDAKILESARQDFYAYGKKCGTRKQFLDYIWYNCAVPAKNYSFNLAHGVAYTIILIIEMNICRYYGPIYWQTACLSVNAGMYGDKLSEFKNPDYNKLDKAMGNPHIKSKLINPDINKSSYGFVPYEGHILYGLYPISGVGRKDCQKIINERSNGAYKSFKDFLKRTKLSKRENIQLIKAGCFDKLESKYSRMQLMDEYIKMVKPAKKRLTMTQVPKMAKHHLIPSIDKRYVEAYQFRSMIKGRKKIPLSDTEGRKRVKKIFMSRYYNLVKPYARTGQMSLLGDNSDVDPCFKDKKGNFRIKPHPFNRWYQHYVEPLKRWLKLPEALEKEAGMRRGKLKRKYCLGNQASWEMDSLGCYVGPHELSLTPISARYGISDYSKIPVNPKKVITKFKSKKYGIYRKPAVPTYAIYGTVIGKRQNKALISLLTPHGIANVRVGKWRYPMFNKKIIARVNGKRKSVKKSWFDRGTKLLCVGHRSGSNFFLSNNLVHGYHGLTDCLYRINGVGSNAVKVDVEQDSINPYDKDTVEQKKTAKSKKSAKTRATAKPKQVKPKLSKRMTKIIEHLNIKFNGYF